MTVLVATPLIDGRGDREFINGLLQSQGLFYAWACVEGQSHISLARDLLAAQFLESGCDTLIDGDIGFTLADLEKLIVAPRPFVSGMYARKVKNGPWIFKAESENTEVDERAGGLLPVRSVPTGFLRIDRKVFLRLIEEGICPPYSSSFLSVRLARWQFSIRGLFLFRTRSQRRIPGVYTPRRSTSTYWSRNVPDDPLMMPG